MRRLLVLRHAEADDHPRDLERPLTPRGEQDAKTVADWVARRAAGARIVASPAVRTRATADAVSTALDVPNVALEDRVYEATLQDLLDVLADHVEEEAVVLVGHNPGLSQLVAHLAAEPVAPLPPAGAVLLDASQGLRQNACPVLGLAPEDHMFRRVEPTG